ncbi:YgiW/YdeI family stress tolerance OB fold protein [Sodalis sp. C49]|uniref:YgiW/YdeI family stress tolerance OB fold protein n=1 Tax=unclassified Sodalis (in: enterobacteria) TaxID=2636512 RepID=UPI003965915C
MMKKATIAALILLCSLPALAQNGGFHGDEPPPPPDKQQSGFRGSADAKQVTIKQAKGMKDNAWVTLQGNIEKKLGGDKYLFRDHTGSIEVEIDNDKWNGQDVSPKDLLVISGKLDKDRHGVNVDVEHLLKQ